jgi:ferritin-like metal-binding protein YciE
MATTQTNPGTAEAVNSKLREFFVEQLQDIYWAEQKLVKTLPKMEEAASSGGLKQAFNSHLQETKNHVSRLEKVFDLIEEPADAKKCHAMAGIVDEGEEIIDEIATYGGLIQLARTLGYTEAAELLGVTLAEEKKADSKLTQIAESGVNMQAKEEIKED